MYILFYVIAGAGLEMKMLKEIGIIGLLYFFARALGKIAGSYLGSIMSNTGKDIRNYMGLALMPQAGVAIGLAIIAKAELPDAGSMIFFTIIATTIVYEILGPIGTKYALSNTKNISY